jgi:hypothetical protein
MARSTKVVTTTGAVTATLLGNGSASIFYGLVATGAGNAAVYYVKLWWEGTGTAPPAISGGAQPATTLPTAGTTVPSLVIPIPVAGLVSQFGEPLNNGGRIWYWIATGVADSSTTVLAAGGDAVTFIYD